MSNDIYVLDNGNLPAGVTDRDCSYGHRGLDHLLADIEAYPNHLPSPRIHKPSWRDDCSTEMADAYQRLDDEITDSGYLSEITQISRSFSNGITVSTSWVATAFALDKCFSTPSQNSPMAAVDALNAMFIAARKQAEAKPAALPSKSIDGYIATCRESNGEYVPEIQYPDGRCDTQMTRTYVDPDDAMNAAAADIRTILASVGNVERTPLATYCANARAENEAVLSGESVE